MNNNSAAALPVHRERINYIDAMRVFATFFVVMIHTIYQSFDHIPVTTSGWKILNVYDSLSRWSVPIFIMISGVLFLGSQKTLKNIFKKNIVRLIVTFYFWSLVYALLSYFRFKNTGSAISQFIQGHYHMWFLVMIIGLYLVTPILRKVAEEKSLTKLFLILALIFAALIPDIQLILGFFPDPTLTNITNASNSFVKNFHMYLPLGYAGYFVLGYALNKYKISRKLEYIIYILGVAGIVFTIIATEQRAVLTNTAYIGFYSYTKLNVAAPAAAVFVFFKQHVHLSDNSKLIKPIRALSKYSLGVYIVHLAILEFMNMSMHITPASFNPALSTLVICLSVTVISYIISAIINHIPFLNKYIV